MNNILDKEILCILDLMNLDIQFANIGNEIRIDGTIAKYHTIASFLEAEYDGIDQRLAMGVTSYPYVNTQNQRHSNSMGGAEEMVKSQEEIANKYKAYQALGKNKMLGSIYADIFKDKEKKDFQERIIRYYNKEQMRRI